VLALEAAATVFTLATLGWSRTSILTTGGLSILLAAFIALRVVTRTSLAVKDGTITIRYPFRTDVSLPVSSVARVVHLQLAGGLGKLLYRGMYVLISSGESTLALLPERSYRSEQLAALLSLFPSAEQEPTSFSLRRIQRTFKVSTPISAADCTLMALSYVLLFGGLGLLIAGSRLHH